MGKLDAFNEIIERQTPATNLTWLRIGGAVDVARPRSERELAELLKACREDGVEARALGDGSNVLIPDDGSPRLAVRLSDEAFGKLEINSPQIVAGAGVKLGRLATAAASAGLAGVEGLVGVPGEVGAGVALNVSTHDVSIGQWVESARVVGYDGVVRTTSRDDFVFGYRGVALANAIVVSVAFRLEPDSPEELAKRLQKIWIARKKQVPELLDGEGVARMFKNPIGQNAAELVDALNFRGVSVGGAKVSESDPNLVVAARGCSHKDVQKLLDAIQAKAREEFGVELERELENW